MGQGCAPSPAGKGLGNAGAGPGGDAAGSGQGRPTIAPDTPEPGARAENLLPRCHFVKCLLPVVTLPLYLLVFIF